MNFTPQEHLANLKLALECWGRVNPELVTHNLLSYEEETPCGTAACFGGWLPHFPEFAAMGVLRDGFGGQPIWHSPEAVSPENEEGRRFLDPETLFGYFGEYLFCVRSPSENALPLNDHEVVSRRLRIAIDQTERSLGLTPTYTTEELQ